MTREYQSFRKAVNVAASFTPLLFLFVALVCLTGFDSPTPGRVDRVVQTEDGVRLSAHLYRPAVPTAEGALLIHGVDRSKEDFAVLANELASRGVSVLALDLRGHGASLERENYKGETEAARADLGSYPKDILAGLKALRSELPSDAAIFLAGGSEGASLATWAADWLRTEELDPYLCLYRPDPTLPDVPLFEDETIPAIVLVGRTDLHGRQVARKFHRESEAPREVWQLDGGRGVAETMLSRTDFCADLAEWFVDSAQSRRADRRRAEATTSIESR